MKATGIIRPVDNLGRLVLPKELRKVFHIEEKDELEIFVEDNMIILKKYEPVCIFCGKSNNLVELSDKSVCSDCVALLNNKLNS